MNKNENNKGKKGEILARKARIFKIIVTHDVSTPELKSEPRSLGKNKKKRGARQSLVDRYNPCGTKDGTYLSR